MTFLDFFKRVPGTSISLRIFKKEFQVRSGDWGIIFDEEYHVAPYALDQARHPS
jgi:hypothetical protein